MDISYVAQDLEWTEPMRQQVNRRLVEPLRRHLKTSSFQLSLHLECGRKRVGLGSTLPEYKMWAVLQTFDGRSNEIVRCQGVAFCALIEDVARALLEKTAKAPYRARYAFKAFDFLPFERTA